MQSELLAVADRSGTTRTAAMIDALVVASPDRFAPYCHAVAHNLGDQLGARESAEYLTTRAPYTCYGGLWHGFLSQRGDMLSVNQFAREVAALCDSLLKDGSSPPVVVFDCVHGVGHGFGMVHDLNFQEALQRCAMYVHSAQRYDCATGVASALSTRALTDAGLVPFDHGQPPPPDARFPRVLRTCSAVDDRALQRGCWERMAAFVEASGATTADLADACREASDWQWECARSLGLRLGAVHSQSQAQEVESVCGVFGSELVRGCLDGVLWHTAAVQSISGSPVPVCESWSTDVRQWCRDQFDLYVSTELGPSRDPV